MIYLDNAATTMHKPQEMIEAVVHAMGSLGNAGRGANTASLGAARIIYEARERLARLFGADEPKQIAFTLNSTESLNTAIRGLLGSGDHVITTMLEHNSVLRPLYDLQDAGTDVTFVKADEKGRIRYEDIEEAIRPKTKAIVTTHGSNLTGNMLDIGRIGKMAHDHGLLYIVDAIHPLKSGGSGVQTYSHYHPTEMPTALEAGTLNGHGIAGLNAAVAYIERVGMDQIRETEQKWMWMFYEGVRNIPGIKVYGDFDVKERCPIVTLNIGDYDSGEVSDELLMTYDISTRAGGHCAPLMHEALGTAEQGSVRFSFSHFNTEEEIRTAIRAVEELAKEE